MFVEPKAKENDPCRHHGSSRWTNPESAVISKEFRQSVTFEGFTNERRMKDRTKIRQNHFRISIDSGTVCTRFEQRQVCTESIESDFGHGSVQNGRFFIRFVQFVSSISIPINRIGRRLHRHLHHEHLRYVSNPSTRRFLQKTPLTGYGGESGLSDLPESATVSEIQRTNILPSAPPPPGYENNQNNTGSEALGIFSVSFCQNKSPRSLKRYSH